MDKRKDNDDILATLRDALRPLAEGILAITEEIRRASESAEDLEGALLSMETPSKTIQ